MSKPSLELDEKIRARANHRCEYCVNPQKLIPHKLEIEHIHPESLGGETVEDNLCLACRECNGHKAARFEAADPLTGKIENLFNPRQQRWHDHFDFSQDKNRNQGHHPLWMHDGRVFANE